MPLSDNDIKNLMNESREIAIQSGAMIVKNWHSLKKIQLKDKRDISTNIDREAENFIREKLKKLYPQAGFMVEEGVSNISTEFNWVIDPIDGTKEYIADVPMFYTQFALNYKEEPILAHIYQPISGQLFSTSKNTGAFLNGKQIVSVTESVPENSIIDLDIRGNTDCELKAKIFSRLIPHFYRVRICGGRFSPYLITGHCDAILDIFRDKKFVDVIPRILLYREAGLKAEYIEIQPKKKILICANEKLFHTISQLVTV